MAARSKAYIERRLSEAWLRAMNEREGASWTVHKGMAAQWADIEGKIEDALAAIRMIP